MAKHNNNVEQNQWKSEDMFKKLLMLLLKILSEGLFNICWGNEFQSFGPWNWTVLCRNLVLQWLMCSTDLWRVSYLCENWLKIEWVCTWEKILHLFKHIQRQLEFINRIYCQNTQIFEKRKRMRCITRKSYYSTIFFLQFMYSLQYNSFFHTCPNQATIVQVWFHKCMV